MRKIHPHIYNMSYLNTGLITLLLFLAVSACKKDDNAPVFSPCDIDFSVSEVLVEPDSNNVLRQTIYFKNSSLAYAYVDYWPLGASDKKRSILSENAAEHTIPLINMTASTEYRYEIISITDSCTFTSEEFTFSTGELPAVLPTINLVNADLDFPGYLYFNSYLPAGVFAANSKGEIVWYELFNSAVTVSTIIPGHSFTALLGSGDYVQKDFFGNELRYYDYLSDFYDYIHHELFVNNLNEAVLLVDDYQEFDFSSIGGSANSEVRGDAIVIFDKAGTEVWRWSIYDVLNPIDDPNILSTMQDWTHSNAIAYDTDGNLLLSVRNFDQIWKINRQDGSLMWKLGVDGDFAMDTDDYFYHQHAVHLTPDGNMMLFDNGELNWLERSRALIFNINENDMTASTSLKIELPEAYFSTYQSNCVMMGSDKVLFGISGTNTILITDLAGDILWEANVELISASFYRVYYFEEFY